jgi:hypothetical protein
MPPGALLAAVPLEERARLSRFQNLIFLGDHGNLPAALRASSPALRVVQVAEDRLPPGCTPRETDILVAVGAASANLSAGWRRVLVAQDSASVAAALGRALQEAGPKALNLLLPAWGECPYEPNLLDRDPEYCDGLVFLAPGWRPMTHARSCAPARTFSQMISSISSNLRGVLLTETTMWRYRSLVDAADGAEDWAALLGLMLSDGMRFDVRAS